MGMQRGRPTPRRGSGFSFDVIRLPLAALGIVCILAGLGYWMVTGLFELPPRILISAGVLLLGIYVAIDPEDVLRRLSGRGALYSGNVLVIGVAALAILGLFNVAGSRYQSKWDLTANKRFTLAQESVKVAQNLPQPVQVTGFFSSQDSSRQSDFQTLLNDYSQRSGGKLTYQFIDPDTHPSDAIAQGVKQVPAIIYQMGDKKQNSTGTAEQDITTALIKLTRDTKKVYFTQGHGERDPNSFNQQDYSQIKDALTHDNFTVDTLSLITQRAVPDDAAEVIIAGPTTPFSQEEKDALKAYLDGGGSLMLMLDPGSKADFNDLLKPYQVAYTGNLVVDLTQAAFGDGRVPVVIHYGQGTITQDLRQASFYPVTTNITYPADASSGPPTVTALALTSDQAWGETDPQALTNAQAIKKDPNDPSGPLAVAVSVEQPVSTGDQASPTPTPTADRSQPAAKKTRIVLFGTSNVAANTFLNVASGNQDLVMNSANWLAEQEDLISIRTTDADTRTMLLTNWQFNLIFWTSLLFLPAAVAVAGVAVWWARR